MAVIGSIVTAFKVAGLAAVRAAVQTLTAGLARLGAAGVRAMAAFATKTIAAAAALKTLAKVGAFGVIKESIDSTIESMKNLKSLASLLRMPPEFVAFFENEALTVGIDSQDLKGIFAGFAAGAQEAAADVDSEYAKVFNALGVRVTDAKGRLRAMNEIFLDLAQNSVRMDPAVRGFRLNQIFGDDDAQKVSPLLDKLGQIGKRGVNEVYQRQLAQGEIVRQSDLAAVGQYQQALGLLRGQLGTIARQIAIDVGPKLATIFIGLARTLRDNRDKIVGFFTDVYKRAERFAADVLIVFGKIDVDGLFRIRNDVQNTWLFQLKAGLLQAVEIAKLLAAGFVAIGRAADTVFKRIFGFSIEEWARKQTVDSLTQTLTGVLDYIRRFILDLGLLFQGLFTSDDFQTGLGESIGAGLDAALTAVKGFVQSVSETVSTVVGYFRTAFGEIRAVFDFGTSSALATTALGLVGGTVVEVTRAVRELFNQFEKVFKLGEEADQGYEWVEDLHTVLTSFVGTLTTFVEIMQTVLAPLQSIISLFGDWSAAGTLLAGTVLFNVTNALTGGLLGAGVRAGISALITQLGTAGLAGAFAGLLNPIGLATTAIGLLIAGYVALKKLSDDDRDRGLEKARQLNDASFDTYGAKPGSGYRSPANTNSASPVLSKEDDEYIQKVALEVPGIPRDVLVKMSRSELDYMLAFNGRRL